MKKLSIEIDVADRRACVNALERIYEAIEECHGERGAASIWSAGKYGSGNSPKWRAREKFDRTCNSFTPENLRLVVEYYNMAKPNKQRLADELVRRNETLPQERRYGPRGTTYVPTMLKQIKRALENENCREVANFTAEQRAEALQKAEAGCFIHNSLRLAGIPLHRPKRAKGHSPA